MQRLWPQTRTAWMILAALLALAGTLLLPARLRGQEPDRALATLQPGAVLLPASQVGGSPESWRTAEAWAGAGAAARA
jgi:hypothetical protein